MSEVHVCAPADRGAAKTWGVGVVRFPGLRGLGCRCHRQRSGPTGGGTPWDYLGRGDAMTTLLRTNDAGARPRRQLAAIRATALPPSALPGSIMIRKRHERGPSRAVSAVSATALPPLSRVRRRPGKGVFSGGPGVGGFVDSWAKILAPSASNRSTAEWTLVDSVDSRCARVRWLKIHP